MSRHDPPPIALADALEDFDELLRRKADLSLTNSPPASAPTIATPPTTVIASPKEAEYFRPSGERYIPRIMSIDGQLVKDVDFITAAHADRLPVLLFGPPGTGKTAVLEAALPGLLTIQGTIETEVSDFIGSWVQRPDGSYAWVDGPLPIAMENGLPFLVDEIALIDPRVMAVVYGAMDGRNELVVTANPDRGVVTAKPGFFVTGAFNPYVPGALVSDALLSRFMVHVEVGTDWSLAKKLGVPAQLIQVARNLNLKQRNGQVTAAPQLRELLTYMKVAKTFGPATALANFVGQTHVEDRETVNEQVQAVFGSKPSPLTM